MKKRIITWCCILLVALLILWIGLYYINWYNNLAKQTELNMREQLDCAEWMSDVCYYDDAWRIERCRCEMFCPNWSQSVCEYDKVMKPLKCRCEEN